MLSDRNDRIMKIWDIKSFFYSKIRNFPGIYFILKKEKENLLQIMQSLPPSNKVILDIGCGHGFALELFEDYQLKIGLDYSKFMLRKLGRKQRDIKLIRADALKLPFKNSRFPVVTCIGLSEYIKDKQNLMNQINSILDSNGYLLITISPKSFLNNLRIVNGNHLFLIDPERFEELINRIGLEIIEKRTGLLQIQYLLQNNSQEFTNKSTVN